MSDVEREVHIQACGRHIEAAHRAGDMATARLWLQAEMLAVKERSPAQVARMEEDYFSTEGERARRAAAARALS